MTKILQKESLVLRDIAKEVPISEIQSKEIKKIISDMKEALLSQEDGVAIAAPQIGVSLRIFLISGAVLDMIKNQEEEAVVSPKGKKTKNNTKDLIFINPVIKNLSKKSDFMEEGCLSVRYLYGKVSRSIKATVSAFDENGKKFERGGSGIIAQIFQHEVDHLNGILFIDKAIDLEDLPPGKSKK